MRAREQVLKAHHTLLNGSGELPYFERRGISQETIRRAYIGYEYGAFTYPCIAKEGGLLGIHYKSKGRDTKGKRKQWWKGYANDLPAKGYGKKPDEPAKIIPFGLETLNDLEPGSLVVLCCGEEDALSLRQAGYTSVSQPGAGLLEPVYARELEGFEVVIFYDAGEEQEARKDALKLQQAGTQGVRVAEWIAETPHGADINGRLIEDPKGFEGWVAKRIAEAKGLASLEVESNVSREGEPDAYVTAVYQSPSWPMLHDEAYYGLPGDIVKAMEPHTEADPVALLANQLCAVSNVIGRGAYFRVGAGLHHLKLDVGLVGETAKGRKGTSWDQPRELLRAVAPYWAEERILNGLSSGEGLIYAVRDQVMGRNKRGEEIVEDEGVSDKRLLVVEAELASTLKVMSREGNTLSPIIRQAWDDGRLQVMTRNNPMKATDAHVSIIGHITRAELLRHLNQTETANGFANRFIWLLVKRSKELPFGGEWHKVDTSALVTRLGRAVEFGKSVGEITWGESAKGIWGEVYGPLSEGKLGLFGAVTGRAEAQVVRLASIYAVMDESETIEEGHLMAALALWEYAEQSARYIFGDATGDPVADRILENLRANPEGLTRTQIRDLLYRNKKAEQINQALSLLLAAGHAKRVFEETDGRRAERWFAR